MWMSCNAEAMYYYMRKCTLLPEPGLGRRFVVPKWQVPYSRDLAGYSVLNCHNQLTAPVSLKNNHIRGELQHIACCGSSTADNTAVEVLTPGEAYVYGGLCTSCGQHHYIKSSAESNEEATNLVNLLDTFKRFDYEASGAPDPRFTTRYVFTDGPGRMLGVLVCKNSRGEKVVLKAFSGQMTESWYITGWVGPVAGITSAHNFYQDFRTLIESLNQRVMSIQYLLDYQPKDGQASECRSGSMQRKALHGPPNGAAITYAHRRQAEHTKNAATTQKHRHHGKVTASNQASPNESTQFLLRQLQLLKGSRKMLSHHLLYEIQNSYVIHDFKGVAYSMANVVNLWSAGSKHNQPHLQTVAVCGQDQEPGKPTDLTTSQSVSEAAGTTISYNKGVVVHSHSMLQRPPPHQVKGKPHKGKFSGFPAGTGDCCAPKLLHAATQRGLYPVSLVEFWYGSPPNTATAQGRSSAYQGPTRQHRQFYGMCSKCETILGTMLCGWQPPD